MKIEIHIGNSSENTISYGYEQLLNNRVSEKKRMYEFLKTANNCIINNVSPFLLYALNTCIMAYIIKDKVDIDVIGENSDYFEIPQINPVNIKVYEISEHNDKKCIQCEDGLIGKNYYNELMNAVMDDYYVCLNWYGDAE